MVVRNQISEYEGRATTARGAMEGEESKLEAIRREAIDVEKEIEARREGIEVRAFLTEIMKKDYFCGTRSSVFDKWIRQVYLQQGSPHCQWDLF